MKKILYYLGYVFVKLRYLIYRIISVYNSNVINNDGGYISGQTILSNPKNIYMGSGSSINGGQIRAGKKAKIIIGENCIISYNVHIRADSHNYNNIEIPIKEQGNFEKDIIIGNNVWIGYGVQIMLGVKIGNNSIIGAGSIVTHNVAENEVVGGIPAKKIRSRSNEKN